MDPSGPGRGRGRENQPEKTDVPLDLFSQRLRLVLRDNRSGGVQTEAQWLAGYLVQKFQNRLGTGGHRQWDLLTLVAKIPGAGRLALDWASHDLPLRMAALAYCRDRPGVADELGYCLRAIEQQWDGVLNLLPQAQAALDRGDYVIEV